MVQPLDAGSHMDLIECIAFFHQREQHCEAPHSKNANAECPGLGSSLEKILVQLEELGLAVVYTKQN